MIRGPPALTTRHPRVTQTQEFRWGELRTQCCQPGGDRHWPDHWPRWCNQTTISHKYLVARGMNWCGRWCGVLTPRRLDIPHPSPDVRADNEADGPGVTWCPVTTSTAGCQGQWAGVSHDLVTSDVMGTSHLHTFITYNSAFIFLTNMASFFRVCVAKLYNCIFCNN